MQNFACQMGGSVDAPLNRNLIRGNLPYQPSNSVAFKHQPGGLN